MLQINNETAHAMFYKLMERFDKIEKMLERQNKMKECLDGDTLLDNYDLSKLLGVTHRTLARYRQKKLIRYYMIDAHILQGFRGQGLLRAEGLATSGKHEK